MSRTQIKLICAVILGVLDAWLRHYFVVKSFHLGREGYLAQQAHYFDTNLTRHSWTTSLVIGVVGVLILIAVYELLTRLLSRSQERQQP